MGNTQTRVLAVFGTRPEAIKMAPVLRALSAQPDRFACRICVTAQHRQMLDQVLECFAIPVHHDLNIMRPAQGLQETACRVLEGLRDYFLTERPDWVLVHGDTTTTFAASLAAFYSKLPVGHVEAGLRTRERYSPFPEEMNRRLTSVLASLHFAPTLASRDNLLHEGVSPDDIVVTGNTAIDALHLALRQPQVQVQSSLFREGSRGILVTAHRRESFGEGVKAICRALRTIAGRFPDVHVIYPVHHNPNIANPVRDILGALPNISLIPPVGYDVFVRLMRDCYLILTDSGGVQEEAPSLGKPVLLMRTCTERPEGVAAGNVRLVGADEAMIVKETECLLTQASCYAAMAQAVNPYGDGHAADRIVAALRRRIDPAAPAVIEWRGV